MKILIANPGSTSYKSKLYDMEDMSILFQTSIERIGDENGLYSYRFGDEAEEKGTKSFPDYLTAVKFTLEAMARKFSLDDLDAVGFKTVHAKGVSGCVELNEDVINAMRDYMSLAPVHTQVYLNAISVFQEVLQNIPLVGLFETAFHTEIPDEAFLYGIPYEYYQKYGIRKYGFHGASHRFIAMRAKELYNADKIISCHLGSSSVCAIKEGRSIDTSMGMSPQSGLLNANRVGDFDSFALLYLMEQENMSIEEVRETLIKRSGLYGISGKSGDFRDVEEAMNKGDHRASLAFKTFAYYVKRYIGEYLAILNSADCIVFTAGAGQNSPSLRKEILKNMDHLGIVIDQTKNKNNPKEGLISSDGSALKVAIIPTNEEYVVAREIEKFLHK